MTSSANAGSAQDTEQYPVKFRAGRGIKALERGLVAFGDGAEQPDELRLHQHDRPRPPRAAP